MMLRSIKKEDLELTKYRNHDFLKKKEENKNKYIVIVSKYDKFLLTSWSNTIQIYLFFI